MMMKTIRWRAVAYLLCAVLVTVSSLNYAVAWVMHGVLQASNYRGLHAWLPYFLLGYGTLVPNQVQLWAAYGSTLQTVLGYVAVGSAWLLLAAVLRRCWLTMARGQRLPDAFGGKLYVLAVC